MINKDVTQEACIDYELTVSNDANEQTERRKSVSSTNITRSFFSLGRTALTDLLSTNLHSKDFVNTRTSFITSRLWLICIFFALSVPVCSFLDFILFSQQEARYLFAARLLLSFCLFILAFILKNQPSVRTVRIVMPIVFLVPMFFFIFTMVIISPTPNENIPAIFEMMPYFILAMLGLFPLTISGGALVISLISIQFVGFELWISNNSYWVIFNDIWLFLLFAGISLWLQVGQLSMLMKLYRESTVDPLTKLINRRVLFRLAANDLEKQSNFCLIMFDLDRFKRINDTYGHGVGDKVLVSIAQVIQRELRQSDIVARFGGEEFVAILPEIGLEQATRIGQRIRRMISQESVQLTDGLVIKTTSSIGVTQKRVNESLDETLKRADDFLYYAKENGRNQVVSDIDNINPSL
ncbi:diguanylate cyclase [Psychromonas ingrahamii 37]|uniref:diguanylate cyclase n=1 Tax=Psychromonas ingrahamii (strain DSM 17664 / CCUG 51855 / 37) TaxID=357804 RepID=A1SZ67_PSYIN|nr:GGDEF domain-containing protein [Psychromonas ingrahamii]ABM04782.1 diguanylate cyclase [Psychromonas ingrahamii 37]